MPYEQNQKKSVVVVNPKASVTELLNGAGHGLLGLAWAAGPDAAREMQFLDYRLADGTRAGWFSTFPVIVLQPKSVGHLLRLHREAAAAGVPCQTFVRAMLGDSAEGQLAATAAAPIDGHDVIAVCLWGDATVLDPLLKRFSCYRERTAPGEAS